jgi:hypothetical protein
LNGIEGTHTFPPVWAAISGIRECVPLFVASYPDTEQIPLRNIALMKRLGIAKLKQLLQACFS